MVAAPGLEPGTRGYEPRKLPLLHATILAGSRGFEPRTTESKSVELPLLHEPINYSFPPILRILSLYFRNYCGDQPTVSIVVSSPMTAVN